MNILPRPVQCQSHHEAFYFSEQTHIRCPMAASEGIRFAAHRLSEQLDALYHVSIPVLMDGSLPDHSLFVGDRGYVELRAGRRQQIGAERQGGSEEYALSIDADGACLQACESVGFYWGVQTLLQLVEVEPPFRLRLPGMEIVDRPRYAYRGLMLDPARHFLSIDFIKRTIEAMALCKLNTLHLHLTDDQSVRIESKAYPELTRYSSRGVFYPQTEMRELIAFAAQRGVSIIPEFDMPAHADALMHALPFLHCSGKRLELREKRYGNNNTAICVSKDSTWRFIETFFAEMAALFPAPFTHIGSDEVGGAGGNEAKTGPWDFCDTCQALASRFGWSGNRLYRELQSIFVRRVQNILQGLGKKLMGWEEITFAADLSEAALVQHWSWSGDQLAEILKRGYPVILSQLSEHRLYLDYRHEDLSIDCLYSNSLLPAKVSGQETALVRGVEACMWCYPQQDLDFLIWPRLLVAAEFGWAGDGDKNLPDFLRRCEKILELLRRLYRIDAGPLYPPYINRASIRPPDTF